MSLDTNTLLKSVISFNVQDRTLTISATKLFEMMIPAEIKQQIKRIVKTKYENGRFSILVELNVTDQRVESLLVKITLKPEVIRLEGIEHSIINDDKTGDALIIVKVPENQLSIPATRTGGEPTEEDL